ncbi:MAG: N-acetylmuramoyl-L-alanine amidase [Gemmatimonadaceae bacterium]|nr:N-acetylmuramoyl-L-alanine amidase [Gemmatimonadaceae bacterium]
MADTQTWPFVAARHFKEPSSPRAVRLVVIHDMEFPEKVSAAEDVARYFATTATPASAHICVDSDSIVQCVYDRNIAYAAPGANHDGIQVELAGYGRQTRAEWLDRYGVAMLAHAADAVSQYAIKFDIPLVHLTNAQLKAGEHGVIGHYQASQVYRKSDHTDPGPGFPWSYFMGSARLFHAERTRGVA